MRATTPIYPTEIENRRVWALSSLICYAEELCGYEVAGFQEEFARALMDFSKQVLVRIWPPEHGKTEWAGILYPAWKLARYPQNRFCIVSASASQAEARSRAIMETITSETYRTLFPHIRPGNKWSEAEWSVAGRRRGDKDSTMLAVGSGSKAIIGRRLDDVLVDDPLDLDGARSEAERTRLAAFLRGPVLSRLAPRTGRIIYIGNRFHEDDAFAVVTGFTSANVLVLPAENPLDERSVFYGPDGSLWPSVWPMEFLRTRHNDMGTVLYNCMYMGDPAGLEGRLFKREWFPIVNVAPPIIRSVTAWDLAASERTEADYTVKTTVGLGEDKAYYVLDVWRGREEWPKISPRIRTEYSREKPCRVGIEAVAFQIAAIQEMRRAGLPVIGVPITRDKVSRAYDWLGHAEAGQIRLVRARWNDDWLHEVHVFPEGAHDDQVDSFSLAWPLLARREVQVY